MKTPKTHPQPASSDYPGLSLAAGLRVLADIAYEQLVAEKETARATEEAAA